MGKNLQDHVAMGGLTFTANAPISINLNRVYSLKAVMQYAVMGNGPLSIPGGVEGLGFVNTKYANASDDFPDIEYHFVSGEYFLINLLIYFVRPYSTCSLTLLKSSII